MKSMNDSQQAGNGEARLIRRFLETKGIWLPLPLLKGHFISELDKTLSKGSPIALSNFFKKKAEEVEKYIEFGAFNNFVQSISEINQIIDKEYGNLVTEDDEKIINFLVSQTNFYAEDFLSISGSLYYVSHVVTTLNREGKNIPDLISVTLFLYLFTTVYEIIIYQVDRRLYNYLRKYHKKLKNIKGFMKVKRMEYNDHATAFQINQVLYELSRIPFKNSSIFGDERGLRKIRNKIAHGNFFYDEKNKVLTVGMKNYRENEFLREYYTLYAFLVKWVENSVKPPISNIDLKVIFKKAFEEVSRMYKKVERASEYKRAFQSQIIRLKTEDKERP